MRADLNCFNDRIWGEFGLCDDSCLEGVSMLADDATREEGAKIYLKKMAGNRTRRIDCSQTAIRSPSPRRKLIG